jgi:hypothetical protein
MDYVLEQIEKVSTEKEYLHDAILELGKINSVGSSSLVDVPQSLAVIVKSREETNQRLLSLYEKMYDDLKSQSMPSEKERLVAMFLGQLETPKVPPTTQDAIVDILATSLQDLSKNI